MNLLKPIEQAVGGAFKDIGKGVDGMVGGLGNAASSALHGDAKGALKGLFQAGKGAFKAAEGATTLASPEKLAANAVLDGGVDAVDALKSKIKTA